MTEDWMPDDPFANPEDPAAREREQRRLEREEKRRAREAKRAAKEGGAGAGGGSGEDSPSRTAGGSVESSPEPPDESPAAEVPLAPRGSEEEFWDEGAVVDEGPGVVEVPFEGEAIKAPPVAPAPKGRRGGSGGGFLAAVGRHPFRLVGAIVAVVVIWFLFALFQPFHGDGSGQVQVTVPKGASVSEVGDLLGEKGVIDSSTLFQVRVTLEGKRSELYAGHFTLAEGMSYGAAIDALSRPPVKRVTTVTIPEGYSRAQTAQLVEEIGLAGDYTKETVRSKYLNPARYGGKGAKDLEGFLFPDTFEMKPGAPVADLVQLQLEDFKRRIKGVDMSYAKSKNLTVFDVLIIASLIEDEAGIPSQRKLVASVVYNRLHEGMPLGIDATIRFAVDNYTQPLTESELAVDSPYNTRTNVGLPPGPINSPGLTAIEAAAHPAKSDFLFYVNKPNTCNELAFAETEAEFEANVAKYNEAREANGGNEPSTCGE
ncbi:MAG TPA: endolytic transglycosylase MltG [Solirubrobacterales bacterium]|nr:endolytic transglycosylase MltG [Solirubrobacterales bacterium]